MMSYDDLIHRVRYNTHDEQVTGYTDETLMGFINDGVRFIRRIAMKVAPDVISDIDLTGELEPGECRIQLDDDIVISHVSELRVNGRRLEQVNRRDIIDTSHLGEPIGYYMTGFKTINLYPVPNEAATYSILAVSDFRFVPVTSSKEPTPFPNELDDFLVEYCVIRASVTNEFDMSQEMSIMSSILSQLMEYLNSFAQNSIQVDGYWNNPSWR